MTISWPLSRQQVLDQNGRPILDVRAFFYEAGTTAVMPVYADPGLVQPLPSPVVPDATGRFPRVYLPVGLYREVVFSLSIGTFWDDNGLGVAPPEDGEVGSGSGGSTPPTDMSVYFSTGDVKWRVDNGLYPGFVRMNGKTIGGVGSGATEFADVSTKALFLYLWNSFPDSIAPVVGGRGSTAGGDFEAGRQITLPDMRGTVQAGLDDMGASASLRLQVAVALQISAGSNDASVAAPDGLAIGMGVYGDGVAKGSTILDIEGTSVTLSVPATLSGTVIARFGAMDAQQPGASGGKQEQTLENRNLPVNMPDGVAAVTFPSQTYARNANIATASLTTASGASPVQNLLQDLKTDQTTPPSVNPQNNPVTTVNANGGVPVMTVQPTCVGTFYMKL
ncbi:hypothetical protein PQI07_06580 [Methylobacterium sp. 092160098-2]|uniref:hypothetical protein n=1 Tax=Methylobacterium sp. 092160098-2 TaxID=3025129 RepID=UPI002381A1D9|nr:hypothetical protein [Methylobacterium sp. 092160098-2]MDE4910367.1 hypothetical protein [Methylobacterium sp. 092160098-2]